MDRTKANKNIRTGLFLAAVAILMFALTFYISILYVA